MEPSILFIGLIIIYLCMALIWIFKNEQLTTLMFSITSLFYLLYAVSLHTASSTDSSLLFLIFFILMTIFGFSEYMLTAFRYLGGEKE